MPLPVGLEQWGLVGVLLVPLLVVFYTILRGLLVPRSVLEDVRKDRERERTETLKIIEIYQQASLKNEKALEELVPMIKEATEQGRMSIALLTALQQAVSQQKVGGP